MENMQDITNNSFINVYDLEHFELYSQTRQLYFRFVKFTGDNYGFLRDYLKNGRDNLEVWPVKRLKRNFYYTFGRDLKFQEVELFDLRCCIASNPFICIDKELFSLSFSRESAKSFLKENDKNYVFCYNEFENDTFNSIKNLYRFDRINNTYLLFNQDHRRGFSMNDLPISSEWFVGNIQDGLINSQRELKVVLTRDNHSVRFDVDFAMMANNIVRMIYEINKLRDDVKEPIIFNPSWEDYYRFKVIGTAVTNIGNLSNFAIKLYNIVYEETKNNGKNRAQLPREFIGHWFVKVVNELRNNFAHGKSEYFNTGISISDICENYSVGSSVPEDLNGLEKMQEGILRDFISFLDELHLFVKKNARIKGRILCDEYGNVYCNSVFFPEDFQKYVNCYCQISAGNRTDNIDEKTSLKYKYYCDQPDFIELSKKIEGNICIKNNIPYCGDVKMSDDLRNHVGKPVIISKIRVYKGEKICYEYIFKSITNIAGVVIKDSEGNKIVENILLPDFVNEGDCICVPNVQLSSNEKYSYMCVNPQPFEGVVQKTGSCYHCGPFLLPFKNTYEEGDKLCLLHGTKNNSWSKNQYKYFAYSWRKMSR